MERSMKWNSNKNSTNQLKGISLKVSFINLHFYFFHYVKTYLDSILFKIQDKIKKYAFSSLKIFWLVFNSTVNHISILPHSN